MITDTLVGSNIPWIRMFKEARELGLKEPEIVEVGMRVRFIVPLLEPIALKSKTVQVEAQVEAQVDKDILVACHKQPLSSSEIAIALGHKNLSGNIRKALPRLIKAGLLQYTIPDKPRSRLQKYRLTDRGREMLNKIGSN